MVFSQLVFSTFLPFVVIGHSIRGLEKGYCDSVTCTEEVWTTFAYDQAGGYTCGSRILWMRTSEGYSEEDACAFVANEFPETCPCDPLAPTTTTSLPPTAGPTSIPTAVPTAKPVAAAKYYCNAATCTEDVWETYAYDQAGEYTCGSRISWMQNNEGYTESDACAFVTGEFPDVCLCAANVPEQQQPDPATGLRALAMSYNTNYKGYSDGRVGAFGSHIRSIGPAVVGLQECQDADALRSATGGAYERVYGTGTQNYILYDPARFDVVDGTQGWMAVTSDNYAPRTITWAQFRWKGSSGTFWFFNTHLPHNNGPATSPNTHAGIAQQFLRKTNELGANGEPTVVVCDCNPFASNGSNQGSFESNLNAAGFRTAYVGTGQYGGFGGLDKIFVSVNWNVISAQDEGTGSSDHPAITADLQLK